MKVEVSISEQVVLLPFGNSGENPEGIRVGGEGGKAKPQKYGKLEILKILMMMLNSAQEI